MTPREAGWNRGSSPKSGQTRPRTVWIGGRCVKWPGPGKRQAGGGFGNRAGRNGVRDAPQSKGHQPRQGVRAGEASSSTLCRERSLLPLRPIPRRGVRWDRSSAARSGTISLSRVFNETPRRRASVRIVSRSLASKESVVLRFMVPGVSHRHLVWIPALAHGWNVTASEQRHVSTDGPTWRTSDVVAQRKRIPQVNGTSSAVLRPAVPAKAGVPSRTRHLRS